MKKYVLISSSIIIMLQTLTTIRAQIINCVVEYPPYGDPTISTLTYCPINISMQNKQIENNQSNSYLADNNINIAGSGTTFKAKNGSEIAFYAGNYITLNGAFNQATIRKSGNCKRNSERII